MLVTPDFLEDTLWILLLRKRPAGAVKFSSANDRASRSLFSFGAVTGALWRDIISPKP